MSIYPELGVREVINAASTLTELGGALMSESVLAAMSEAGRSSVDMRELYRALSVRIAKMTRNEASWITSSAAAGIALAVLAFRADGSGTEIAKLKYGLSRPAELLMYASHRNPFDSAVALTGASIRTVGNIRSTSEDELRANITENTVGALYVPGVRMEGGALGLKETVSILDEYGVPVLVDAAAQVPPFNNLWRYTKGDGAALAVFSGGKQIGGPQTTGLLVGQEKHIRTVSRLASPETQIGRAFKVGKEEAIGFYTALREFANEDPVERFEKAHQLCLSWASTVSACRGVVAEVENRNLGGAELPRVKLVIKDDARVTARQLKEGLWNHDPRIAVYLARSNVIYLEPDLLTPKEADIVIGAVRDALQ